MMDWSFVKSDLWFIQSFILSNTIEWHFQNTLLSNWMDMREGRFFNSHHWNELNSKWISFNLSQFIFTHLLSAIFSRLSMAIEYHPYWWNSRNRETVNGLRQSVLGSQYCMSILISMEKENLKRIREEDVPTTTAETSKDIRSDTVSSTGLKWP